MPSIEQARSWYPSDDPVHGFDHVLRVYFMAERLAQAEGADLEIVRAAALLHDAGDGLAAEANDHTQRKAHHHASADFAAQALAAEGWSRERISAVQHCIRSHRFRDDSESPQTLEARVLFDADKLDAIGAIGVARALAFAVRRGQPVYAPPSEQFLRTGQALPGEPHSAYHEYRFKLVKLKDRLFTSAARLIAGQRHQQMVDFFERLADEAQGYPAS
jgi:uncharacterized protein